MLGSETASFVGSMEESVDWLVGYMVLEEVSIDMASTYIARSCPPLPRRFGGRGG